MKKIFYIFPIAALISSCSPIVYTSTNPQPVYNDQPQYADQPTTDPLTTPAALRPTLNRLRPHRLRRPPPSLSLGALGASAPTVNPKE